MHTFKNYLSLGNACKTRYQLDRFFTARKPNYQPMKGYFDWLWGGGIEGVIKAFNCNLSISKDDLIVCNIGGTTQVCDVNTGFYFLHDFTFSNNALNDLKLANSEMILQLDQFLIKYDYLASKTLKLVHDNDLLCLVYIGPVSRENFLNLHDLFEGDITLLNILPVDQSFDMSVLEGFEKKWLIRSVDDGVVKGTPNEWMGSNDSFDIALNDFF